MPVVDLGSGPGTNTGDTIGQAFGKINGVLTPEGIKAILPTPVVPSGNTDEYNIMSTKDGRIPATMDNTLRPLRNRYASLAALRAAWPLIADIATDDRPWVLDLSEDWFATQHTARMMRAGNRKGGTGFIPAGVGVLNGTVWLPLSGEGAGRLTQHSEDAAFGDFPGEVNFRGAGMNSAWFVAGYVPDNGYSPDAVSGWSFNGLGYYALRDASLAEAYTLPGMFDVGKPFANDRFLGGDGCAGFLEEFSLNGGGGNYNVTYGEHSWVTLIGLAARRRLRNMNLFSGRYGISKVGDQTDFYNLQSKFCKYGLYFDRLNASNFADDVFVKCKFAGWKAAIGVHYAGIMGKTVLLMCFLGVSPFGVYKESLTSQYAVNNGGNDSAMSGVRFLDTQFEQFGNALVSGGTVRDAAQGNWRPVVQDVIFDGCQMGFWDDTRRLSGWARPAQFDIWQSFGYLIVQNMKEPNLCAPGDVATFRVGIPRGMQFRNCDMAQLISLASNAGKNVLACDSGVALRNAGHVRFSGPGEAYSGKIYPAASTVTARKAVVMAGDKVEVATGGAEEMVRGVAIETARAPSYTCAVVTSGSVDIEAATGLASPSVPGANYLRAVAGGKAGLGGTGERLGTYADTYNRDGVQLVTTELRGA